MKLEWSAPKRIGKLMARRADQGYPFTRAQKRHLANLIASCNRRFNRTGRIHLRTLDAKRLLLTSPN